MLFGVLGYGTEALVRHAAVTNVTTILMYGWTDLYDGQGDCHWSDDDNYDEWNLKRVYETREFAEAQTGSISPPNQIHQWFHHSNWHVFDDDSIQSTGITSLKAI